MSFWEVVKNFVLTTLGHAISGAIVGGLYELTQLYQAGTIDVQALVFGFCVGASIGFFRTIVEELEKWSMPTTAGKQIKKSVGRYFI